MKQPGRWGTLLILASLLLSFIPVTAQVTLAADPPFTVNTFDDPNPTTIAGGCSAPGESTICSLRLALNEAPAGNTTITLPAGTYTLTRTNATNTEDLGSTGDLDIQAGRNITILGAGRGVTFIDGNASNLASKQDRVIDVLADSSLTIGSANDPASGVTIRNGKVTGSNQRGGGLRIQGTGTLTLYHSTVTNNLANSSSQGGGGIAGQGGAGIILEDTLVTNNGAGTNSGGGIYHNGGGATTVQVRNSTVSNNTAQNGGGIYTQGDASLTVTASTIGSNTGSVYGGGINFAIGAANTALLTIDGSTISDNTVVNNGGGLHVSGFSVPSGSCQSTIKNSTFSNNRQTGAGAGGGINVEQACLNVSNSTISGNQSSGGSGGGIRNFGGLTTLTYVTIANNSTGLAAVSYNDGFSSTFIPGTVKARNTIVVDSTSGNNCTIAANNTLDSSAVSDPGYNLDSSTSCGFGYANGNISNTDVSFGPLLFPLALNAPGTTATHALRPSSLFAEVTGPNPAVDRVAVSAASESQCLPPLSTPVTDQRGIDRPQGANCDSGAYELQPAPTIATVEPSSGPTIGGTGITISGTGFQTGATVTVGGNPCTGIVVNSSTSISCTTPAGALGAQNVVVSNPDTQQGIGTGSFSYVEAPPSPSPSASPSPVTTYTVSASANAGGTITPVGTSLYNAGMEVSYTATPSGPDQVFLGWTLDNQYVGYASPLTFTVSSNRTLVAQFAPRPTFTDVPTSDPDYQAITFLAAAGIINPNGVNGSGQFQPDTDVKRAEVAAFIARTFGWNQEFHANRFPDKCDALGQNCIDDELWNNVAALADYGVVGGYTDPATCASAGTTSPCYLPRDVVKRVQVVSVVARAFTKTPDLRPTGFWDRLPANAAQYTNVPNVGSQRSDLTTYRANAGEIPGQDNSATFNNPEGNGSRRFVIQALFQAFNAQFSVDRVP